MPWAGALASCGASMAMVYCTKISITATVATLFGLNTEEDAVKALILCIVKAQQDTFFHWAWDVVSQQYTEDGKKKVCDKMCFKSSCNAQAHVHVHVT